MRTLVAMSGGVDSSLAAALLRREGGDLIGVTLQLRSCEEAVESRSCCGVDGIAQARAVAGQLGIPHYVLDCRAEFEERVLRPAWSDYARGRTPSPCVRCNQAIKFGLLWDRFSKLGAERLVTGHYARVERDGAGRPWLCRARDATKDQSYFLFALTPEQLERVAFPLEERSKAEVRALARELGLVNADRAESQDACLVSGERGFAESLRLRFEGEARPGRIVSPDGKVLGTHEGVHHFTVGQRRGLGVALGQRAFVSAIRPDSAEVVVTADERAVWAEGLEVRLEGAPGPLPVRASVQVRSRHRAVPARLEAPTAGTVRAWFDEPQRAVTPGQAAVFYDGDRVLGGGWIERALNGTES